MSGEEIPMTDTKAPLPISSIHGGIVTSTGRSDRAGNYVIEAGPGGWTLHHHLACVEARAGTMVAPGFRIGTAAKDAR